MDGKCVSLCLYNGKPKKCITVEILFRAKIMSVHCDRLAVFNDKDKTARTPGSRETAKCHCFLQKIYSCQFLLQNIFKMVKIFLKYFKTSKTELKEKWS